MTNPDSLSVSVEASRLRSLESYEDFCSAQSVAARRFSDIEQAASFAPAAIEVHWLGADKFVALIPGPSEWGATFCAQFSLKGNKAFHEVRSLNDFALFVRTTKALFEHTVTSACDLVRDEIALGFLPF